MQCSRCTFHCPLTSLPRRCARECVQDKLFGDGSDDDSDEDFPPREASQMVIGEDADKDDAQGDEKSVGVSEGELAFDTYSEIRPLLEPGETISRVVNCQRVQVQTSVRAVRFRTGFALTACLCYCPVASPVLGNQRRLGRARAHGRLRVRHGPFSPRVRRRR